jgi:hypothetical protein
LRLPSGLPGRIFLLDLMAALEPGSDLAMVSFL